MARDRVQRLEPARDARARVRARTTTSLAEALRAAGEAQTAHAAQQVRHAGLVARLSAARSAAMGQARAGCCAAELVAAERHVHRLGGQVAAAAQAVAAAAAVVTAAAAEVARQRQALAGARADERVIERAQDQARASLRRARDRAED